MFNLKYLQSRMYSDDGSRVCSEGAVRLKLIPRSKGKEERGEGRGGLR